MKTGGVSCTSEICIVTTVLEDRGLKSMCLWINEFNACGDHVMWSDHVNHFTKHTLYIYFFKGLFQEK